MSRWLRVVVPAGATLLSLLIVFAVVAVATTSLANRLAIGIISPGVAALYGVAAISKRDGRQAAGVLIGLTVATPMTCLLRWVTVISSGTL